MKQATLPSISIVTPSFNQGKFIRETIENVLSQNNAHVIYWVIDGESKDNTVSILKSFGKRINWMSEKDKGQTNAINKWLKKTLSGLHDDDIVAYINSDDYYLPNAFSHVRDFFNAHPDADWLVGDALIVDEEGNEIQKPIRFYKRFLRLFPFSLWLGNPYPQPSVFLRARLVKKIGLFREDLHYVMDYEYWLRATTKSGLPSFLNVPLSAFRIHGNSKGTMLFRKQFEEGYAVVEEYTRDSLVLWLHRLHNHCILFVYKLIK